MKIGMRSKIALVVSLIVIIGLGSVSFIGYLTSRKMIVETNSSLIEKTVETKSNEIQNFLDDAITKVEGIALLEGLQNVSPDEGIKALSRVFKHYENTFDNISFANAEGIRWNYKGETDTISDREYFTDAMSTKKPAISDVLISNTTGKLSVVIAAPILDSENNAKGIAYATLGLQTLQEITEKLKYGESGFGFIFDDNGLILSHQKKPDEIGKLDLSKDETNKELKVIWDNRHESNGNEQISYSSSGEDRVAEIMPIKMGDKDIWYFVLSVNEAEILKTVNTLGLNFIIISCIFIISSIIISILYSGKIVSPIVKLNKITQDIAKGNLSDDIVSVEAKDELGQLSNSITLMTNSLRDMVKSIVNKSLLLAASSQELSATTEEFYASAQFLSSSVSKVENNNSEQNMIVQQSTHEVKESLTLLNDLSTNVKNVVNTVDKTAKVANEGRLSVEKAVIEMEEILDASKLLQSFISKLSNKSNEIGTITVSITGIAEQTNLLALNAAIEAARAGESGRGFSVVAEEIRKLAEQSQNSAALISQIIQETQKDTLSAVEEMNSFITKINEGAEVVENSGEIFKNISQKTKEAVGTIAGMLNMLDNVSQGSTKISDAIYRIDEASQTTTTEIEVISVNIEQQTGATEQIASSAEALSTLAEDLNEMVSKFQLE